jgi:hypothetical protein
MKKAVTKMALLLILTSSLIPVLSFAPIAAVTAKEQSFFEDNFENYTIGTFPSSAGWELWYSGMGTDQQIIVDNVSCSPTKSLKLLGIDFWAGFAAKRFTSTSSRIGFEVAVRVEETNGQSRDNARVAFTTKLDAYRSCEYAPVTFQDNGVIISGGQVLQSYVADTWYKIRLVMDRTTDTYAVWVDDKLKGENLTVTTTSGPITDYPSSGIAAFSVSQCYNSVTAYFDDVKVFSSYESDPTLELVPNTGISTTTLVGSGFAPNSQISVSWEDILIPTVPSQVITDGSGSFTCIVSVLNQTHGTYLVKAADELGNEANATFTVGFTIDNTPPNITDVIQVPININETTDDGVMVNATVTDAVSGVERVTLSYTDGNGTWVTTEMAKLEGNIWNGTIPAFPHGTTITYTIMAEDKAGNTVTTEELYGEPNQYEVLPELPLWVIVPLFVTATAFAIVARKRLSSPAFAKVCNSLTKYSMAQASML